MFEKTFKFMDYWLLIMNLNMICAHSREERDRWMDRHKINKIKIAQYQEYKMNINISDSLGATDLFSLCDQIK